MRVDKGGNLKTLEEDINKIWNLHGLKVIEEKVSGNVWTIIAEKDKPEKSLKKGLDQARIDCFYKMATEKKEKGIPKWTMILIYLVIVTLMGINELGISTHSVIAIFLLNVIGSYILYIW